MQSIKEITDRLTVHQYDTQHFCFFDKRPVGLLVITGSHLYGTANQDSDVDLRGFCMPTAYEVMGIENFEQVELKTPDIVLYNFTKFIKLLKSGSPNITELLFVPKDKIVCGDAKIGQRLLYNRDKFISKKSVNAMMGFATSSYMEYLKDTRNFNKAYHAIRSLAQAQDLLKYREINFNDTDRIYTLRSIREGKFELYQIDYLFRMMKSNVEILEENNKLPDEPDHAWIKKFQADTYYTIIKDDPEW